MYIYIYIYIYKYRPSPSKIYKHIHKTLTQRTEPGKFTRCGKKLKNYNKNKINKNLKKIQKIP